MDFQNILGHVDHTLLAQDSGCLLYTSVWRSGLKYGDIAPGVPELSSPPVWRSGLKSL